MADLKSVSGFLRRQLGRPPRRATMPETGQSPPDMTTVFSSPLLRVTALGDPALPNIFICFTGVSQAMGGIGAEEFVGSTRMPDFSALFVSDLNRSWFNAFPPELLTDAIAERVAGRRIVTVGNSMGGFGAIWMTRFLPVSTAIAFAPQFSVHPDIVPQETRWQEFRAQIREWRSPSLVEHFVPGTRYITLNGSDDHMHWSRFVPGDNAEHILIDKSGHEPARALKRHNILSDVIASATHGESPFALIRSAGIGCSRLGMAGNRLD